MHTHTNTYVYLDRIFMPESVVPGVEKAHTLKLSFLPCTVAIAL